MEFIVIIVVIIFGAILYFFGRFANFKSKLMNELGKRGLDFKAADVLYTLRAHEINKLYHDGVPVSSIADIICNEVDGIDQHQAPRAQFSSFDDWFEVFKVECDKTKEGVSPFLEFMNISNLQRAYEAGEDPKVIAYHFAKDFDPLNMR